MIVDHTAALLVTEERSFAQFDKIKPINVPIGSSGRKRSWNDEDDQPVSRWKHVKRLAPSATVTNPAQERATIQEEIATRLDSIDALIWSTGFDRAVDNQKLSDTKGSDTLERDLNSSDFSASNSNSALLNSATSHVTVPYELFEMRISGEQATREPTERTVAPVRLDYIMLNDISVSVLLRTQHRRVVSQIPVTSDSLPEWPLFEASHTHTDLLVVQPDSSTIAGMNSKNELKEQDTGYLKFCSKLEVLRSASHQALESLEWMQGVAYKADAVFSSYDSDSAAFCDHFSAILGTLQTITEGISELTKLPLSYKTALTEKLATYIAPEFVDPVFSFLEKVLQAIKNFKANIGGVQTSTNAMYAAYKTFQNHAATICSEKPFETYGYEVTSISSFIRAVKSRIDTSLGTYTNLEKMGASYLQKLDESTNQQNMSMPVQGLDQDISTCRLQLDETFMSIIGDVERSIQAVEKLPDKLHAVHRTLSVVHDDVRLFGGAVTAISLQCKQVEEKVVAVDMLRVHAERICSAIKPFEQVLARFGIQKDPLWTSDTVDIRASSTAAPVPIQSEDISIVTQFIQLLTSHLPKLAFAGLDLVLDHHLDLTRTRMNLERITEGLALTDRQSLEGNLKAYMQTLGELTATAQPEHSITLGQDQEELDVPSEFRNALSVIDLDHLQMFNAVQEKLSKIQEGFPRSSTSAQFPSEPTVDSKADSIVPPGNTEASSIAKDGSCLPDAIAR
ncbi:hypothetical protein QFC19_006743 [Naganishia cerealis]|uniref:Uncharacterized protein n=1 Tax=Naganishia cerealis TaxID=610337 RepID=A0ACC2VE85_9TREE|nr:hypothetical protein QFC19_006743 [Naganishia cerealis]